MSRVGVSIHRWEFKQSLFDGSIVVYMDTVLEHEVAEVLVGLNKVIQHLQVLQFTPLTIVEDVEVVLVGVELHIFALSKQFLFLVSDGLVSFLKLLFLFLKTSDLFVDLFLHHGVKVLLLDL